MAFNLGFPLIGAAAPGTAMQSPRRSWQERLFDRFAPGSDLEGQDKKALVRQGLLQLAAGIQSSPNFGQGLTSGLLAGASGLSEGAHDLQNQRYQRALMQRTLAGAQRNDQLEALQGQLVGPDGQIDEAKFRQYAVRDPQGAKALRDAIAPQTKYQLGELGTPEGGSVPVFFDPTNPGTVLDVSGRPVFGGQQMPTGGAQTPIFGDALVSSVKDLVSPFGGRITSTTGGQHNPGSAHYAGGAVDVGMGRESPQVQAQILAALQNNPNLMVRDERVRPQGQAVWGGPHLHVEPKTGGGNSPMGGLSGLPGYTPPKAPAARDTWAPLTADEVQAAGLPPGTVAQRNQSTGQIQTIRLPTAAATSGGKALPQGTVEKLGKKANRLSNLQDLSARFADNFAGNVKGGSIENTLGRLGGESLGLATPGQADWWQQYDRYKNEVRNELFGASLTAGEQAAFEAADVTPNMDPKKVRSNIAKQSQIIESALRREGRTWAAQGYNRDAIEEVTGLPLGQKGPAKESAAPTAPKRLKFNPATGKLE